MNNSLVNNMDTSNLPSNISEKIGDMKNIGVSEDIAKHIEDVLINFQKSLSNLDISITLYKELYEKYIDNTMTDADLLKAKMKEKIVRVMNNDI